MLSKVVKICTPSFGILAPQLKFFKSGSQPQEQPLFLQAKRQFLTTEQEFEVIKAFLNGMDSSSTPALREGLQNLGYNKGQGYKKQQNEVWVKNKNLCTLEKFHFGNDVGHKLSLQHSGKKGGRSRRVSQVHFGSVILQDRHWNALADYFQQQLGWFIMARAKHPDHDLPVNLDQLKEYIELGKYKQERLKRVKQERKIQKRLSKLVGKVQDLMKAGKQPKGVIVYAAGPDSVGKTSTGYIIMDALEAAGYNIRVEWFGAPSAEERSQHWLKRFERGVPQKGEAVFWDRGTAGDIVYGNPPANEAKHMCKEFNCFESWTQENGILMVKMQIYCDRIKQSKTFAKRLARAFVAKIIQQELESRGDLSDEHRDSLDEIANKVGVEDYVAFANYKEIEDGFLSYAKRTELFSKWIVADATKRNKARLRIIEEFNNKVHTDKTNVWEH